MTSPKDHFADLTALLEDLHGLAVEGQHPDLCEDISKTLCANLRLGLARGGRLVASINSLSRVAR